MNAEALISGVKARRTAAGLRLTVVYPDRDKPFVCYPRDDAQKRAWIAYHEAKGRKVTAG